LNQNQSSGIFNRGDKNNILVLISHKRNFGKFGEILGEIRTSQTFDEVNPLVGILIKTMYILHFS
jgi:hypothetical protein